jgi:hypothetical protein
MARDLFPGEQRISLSVFIGAQATLGKVHNCRNTDSLVHQFEGSAHYKIPVFVVRTLYYPYRLWKVAPKAIHHRKGTSRFETGRALGDTLPVNAAEGVAGKRLTEARVIADNPIDELSLLGGYPSAGACDADAAGTRSNPDFSGSGVGLRR